MTQKSTSINSQNGFTIIESLIVLAVGGLLILFVFQAVPSLRRSARNDERKQDVAQILDKISRFQLSNSGNFPTDTSTFSSLKLRVYLATPAVVGSYPAVEQPATGIALNYAANTDPTIRSETNTSIDSVWVYNRRKCDTTSLGTSTSRGAGFRDVVALFAVETSGASVPQCRQL